MVALNCNLRFLARRRRKDDSKPMVEHDGDRLRKLMARAGVSQADLTREIDVTAQAVGKWLRTGQIAREHLPGICRYLRCTSDELLGLAPITEPSAEAAAPTPIFTKERRASDDVLALQIGLESLLLAVLQRTPGVATAFLADVGPVAKGHGFSMKAGLLGSLVDIAQRVRSEEEAAAQVRQHADSAGRTKREKPDQAR